jgi:thioredoxin 1
MKKLLWFTAPWCRPCKNMVPVIDELQDDLPDLAIEKIDVEALPSLAEERGVRGLPTFILVENEREAGRIAGATGKDKLLALCR